MGDGFLDKVTAAVRAHGPLCVGIDPSGALLADWGLTDPILSNRDKSNPRRDAIGDGLRPRMVMRT